VQAAVFSALTDVFFAKCATDGLRKWALIREATVLSYDMDWWFRATRSFIYSDLRIQKYKLLPVMLCFNTYMPMGEKMDF
jgi:hypothetical protein